LHTALPLAGTGQALLHAPQCATLASRLTHDDEQAVVPEGHSVKHLPFEQASVAAHFTPQPPQLLGSMCGSTHAPPHLAKPVWQMKPQLALLQTALAKAGTLHALPHAPQFKGSAEASTQAPLHAR
jgi:hypothetical protein